MNLHQNEDGDGDGCDAAGAGAGAGAGEGESDNSTLMIGRWMMLMMRLTWGLHPLMHYYRGEGYNYGMYLTTTHKIIVLAC